MAKFKGKLSLRTINSLKGFLDFYTVGDETIVRTWPKNRGNSQTPASIPWQRVFAFFMACHGQMVPGGPLYIPGSVTGREWTSRDYLMSTYYGKPQMPDGWVFDTREPWPPPMPDPNNRFFIINKPVGNARLGGFIDLRWTRCPQGPNVLIGITDKPAYYPKTFIRRRSKHVTISTYTPTSPFYGPQVVQAVSESGYNQIIAFKPPADKPYYFFVVHTLTHPQRYMSVSPWFVLRLKRKVGPFPWPGTLEGPEVLEPRHIEHPDRPIDVSR